VKAQINTIITAIWLKLYI